MAFGALEGGKGSLALGPVGACRPECFSCLGRGVLKLAEQGQLLGDLIVVRGVSQELAEFSEAFGDLTELRLGLLVGR